MKKKIVSTVISSAMLLSLATVPLALANDAASNGGVVAPTKQGSDAASANPVVVTPVAQGSDAASANPVVVTPVAQGSDAVIAVTGPAVTGPGGEVVPFDTYVPIDKPLTSRTGSDSSTFECTSKYGWYKIWILNNSNVKYKIVVKDNNGNIQFDGEVQAGRPITIRNQNAAIGTRTVSITSTDGSTLNGQLSVRLGETQNEVAN